MKGILYITPQTGTFGETSSTSKHWVSTIHMSLQLGAASGNWGITFKFPTTPGTNCLFYASLLFVWLMCQSFYHGKLPNFFFSDPLLKLWTEEQNHWCSVACSPSILKTFQWLSLYMNYDPLAWAKMFNSPKSNASPVLHHNFFFMMQNCEVFTSVCHDLSYYRLEFILWGITS